MQWYGQMISIDGTSKRTDGDIDRRRRHPRSKCFNTRQAVVALVFSLWNIVRWRWQEDTAPILNNYSLSHQFDEDKCSRAISSSTNNTVIDFMSIEQREEAIQFASKIAMDSTLKGDYVEVNISPSSSCRELGGFSLIAAIAQRAVMNKPYCNRLLVPRRAVWLAFRDERCIEVVSKLFHENKFSVVDPNKSLDSSNGSVDAPPIHLLVGPTLQTLSDAPVEKIALLRVGHPFLREMVESVMAVHDEQLTANTLHALISLYRKVGIGGLVALDAVWLGEVKEFLIDGNHTVLHASTDSTSFVKSDTQIRIPRHYRRTQISSAVDARVLRAWETLNEWHNENETGKRFVGHVGTNAYQTYRYAEAMRQVIDTEKKRSEVGKEVTVNVCETGFNGGETLLHQFGFDTIAL